MDQTSVPAHEDSAHEHRAHRGSADQDSADQDSADQDSADDGIADRDGDDGGLENGSTGASQTAPPALDDDDDVIDAEIVETPALGSPLSATSPAPDYSDAGVPSLDYVRDKIEDRFGTAIGSSELARAGAARQAAARMVAERQAADSAERQRVTRERAATDRLDAIRRSLHP